MKKIIGLVVLLYVVGILSTLAVWTNRPQHEKPDIGFVQVLGSYTNYNGGVIDNYCWAHVMGSLFGDGGGNGAANGTNWKDTNDRWSFSNGESGVVDRFEHCAIVARDRAQLPGLSSATISRTNNNVTLTNYPITMSHSAVPSVILNSSDYKLKRAFLMSVIEGEGSTGGQIIDNSKCLQCGDADPTNDKLNPEYYAHITAIKALTDTMWLNTYYVDGKNVEQSLSYFTDPSHSNMTMALRTYNHQFDKFRAMPFASFKRVPSGISYQDTDPMRAYLEDITAPSITLSGVYASEQVSGVRKLTVQVQDGSASSGAWGHSVRLNVNGNQVLSTTAVSMAGNSSTYEFNLDTRNYPDGALTLSATVTDINDNSSSSSVVASIKNSTDPPVPQIVSFAASKTSITTNETVTFSWTTTFSGASTCTISIAGTNYAIDTPSSGTKLTAPLTSSITSTLSCSQSGHADARTVNITVSEPTTPPVISSYYANPSSVIRNSTTVLYWSARSADSCSVSTYTGSLGASSSWRTPTLDQETNFTLTCTNSAGSTNASLTVGVSETAPVLDPQIITFVADPSSLEQPGPVRLTWSVANTTNCVLAPSPLTAIKGSLSYTINVSQSQAFTLSCVGAENKLVQANTSVVLANKQPPPPPQVSLEDTKAEEQPTDSDTSTGSDSSGTASIVRGLYTINPSLTSKTDLVQKVEYYIDGQLVVTQSSPPFALDTRLITNGTYTITEIIYLKDGSLLESSVSTTIDNSDTNQDNESGSAASFGLRNPLIGVSVVEVLLFIGLMLYSFNRRFRMFSKQVFFTLQYVVQDLASSVKQRFFK